MQACIRCALPLASPGDGLICGECQQTPPVYDQAVALFHYEQPVSHLIQTLKFGRRLAVARTLGRLLAERLQDHSPRPDVLLPVPLHPRRYRERGFNQSAEIAEALSRHLGIPMNTTLCTRIRQTPAQAGLSARARRGNLRGAFGVSKTRLPAHIAIIDDVVTTGTTVNELARTLRRAGVVYLQVWSLARVAEKMGQ
jgi:ComF family protein